jgi:hypothetical protein
MTWPSFTQFVGYWLFIFYLSNMKNKKEETQEIWLASNQKSII